METGSLPMREGRITLDQLPAVNAAHKKNQIEDVKGKYPPQSIAWIDGALRECKGNMHNVRQLAADTQAKINEYSGHISLCKHRDKLLNETKDPDEINKINKQFPPYNVKAMKDQIRQFRTTINECDTVVDKEQDTIRELMELRRVCVERDQKLAALGANSD